MNRVLCCETVRYGIAILQEGRFANAQDSRFQAANVSNVGTYVLHEGQLDTSK